MEKKKPQAPGRDRPGPDYLGRMFESCGLNLSKDLVDRFWTFHQLLRARSEKLDLTRIRSFESLVLKHYIDSAIITQLVDLPSPLLDIGTGAGFPGLPIKIMRPDIEIILAEGRAKKLAFIEEAIQTLGLEKIQVYPHKVTSRTDLAVNGLITRDFEAIEKTLYRASFLPLGGRAIFMKGPAAGPEIEEAQVSRAEEFRLKADRSYNLGRTEHRRRLVVFERISGGKMTTLDLGPKIQEVASVQNQKFKIWKKALEPRGIKKFGLAVMSGPKQVTEICTNLPDRCEALLTPEPGDPLPEAPAGIPRYRLRPELFKELDLFGAGPPLLMVRVPELKPWNDGEWPPGPTLFLPFQDPSNLGAAIRTAAALGVPRIVLLSEAAHPFHPKALRAAGPTVFRVRLETGPALKNLMFQKAPLIALSAQGRPLPEYKFPPAFGLLPGLEGPGLPENLNAAETLAVPMAKGVESLNAAVALGIALYEWGRRGK